MWDFASMCNLKVPLYDLSRKFVHQKELPLTDYAYLINSLNIKHIRLFISFTGLSQTKLTLKSFF